MKFKFETLYFHLLNFICHKIVKNYLLTKMLKKKKEFYNTFFKNCAILQNFRNWGRKKKKSCQNHSKHLRRDKRLNLPVVNWRYMNIGDVKISIWEKNTSFQYPEHLPKFLIVFSKKLGLVFSKKRNILLREIWDKRVFCGHPLLLPTFKLNSIDANIVDFDAQ